MVGAREVQSHVELVADDPSLVGLGRHVKEIATTHYVDPAARESHRGGTGDDEPKLLDQTALLPEPSAHVLGPTPAREADRPAERHVPDLVRVLEACQNRRRHQGKPMSPPS